MYTIILEKIPEKMLDQYYTSGGSVKVTTSKKLKDWVAEEAEYPMQAGEIKNGIGSNTKTREKIVALQTKQKQC